jgi:glutamate-1-semialdehyde 2,1-aminomutase/spore coat polysaccharide biosynthesis protein SpsF
MKLPVGAAPLFVTHGDGGYVFDVDGNDFVDLVGGLLPNILGYRDPDVDRAIREQLDRGISLSLATTLERELAERLNFHIPSAEMVRFDRMAPMLLLLLLDLLVILLAAMLYM